MRAAIIGLMLVSITCCGRGYSEGERSGTIVKFSYKGLFWKSHEGQLALGAMTQDGAPSLWEFHVDDPAVVSKIEQAQRDGSRVSLHYVQWAISPCTQDSDYDVVSVEKSDAR